MYRMFPLLTVVLVVGCESSPTVQEPFVVTIRADGQVEVGDAVMSIDDLGDWTHERQIQKAIVRVAVGARAKRETGPRVVKTLKEAGVHEVVVDVPPGMGSEG